MNLINKTVKNLEINFFLGKKNQNKTVDKKSKKKYQIK